MYVVSDRKTNLFITLPPGRQKCSGIMGYIMVGLNIFDISKEAIAL